VALCLEWKDSEASKIIGALNDIVKSQLSEDITILSVQIKGIPDDKLKEFMTFYLKQSYLDENKIKVSFIGKWYDSSDELVGEIKEVITNTRDYNDYFLNFVINYDGQQEIVDACKILCRQIISEKIDVESIDKSQIKENLYSSYFIPPELMVVQGRLQGFFLWDSYYSEIKFVENLEEFKECLN
jgi:undecaprenyl diphosphate synthase